MTAQAPSPSTPKKIPTSVEQPLSPFLIYRWQITMTMSILHRATGVALVGGLVLLVVWLGALAAGPEIYDLLTEELLRTPVGIAVLAGFSWATFYHLCNGMRHLLWDCVQNFEIAQLYSSGRIVVLASTLLTLCFWTKLYGVL